MHGGCVAPEGRVACLIMLLGTQKISQLRQKLNCPSPQALSRHDFIILLDGILLQFDPATD
jgi:hypothetical protein